MNNLPKPDAPTINVPLLRKTLEHIEAHPEEWDQGDWRLRVEREGFCGTAYCFAGTAANLHGAEWRIPAPADWQDDDMRIVTPEGGMHVEYYAQEILGLNFNQADMLFDGGNDLADLRRIVDGLVAEAEGAS